MRRAPQDDRHGTRYRYIAYKCRCDACREANRLYVASYRKACRLSHLLYPENTPHGTTAGYDDYSCRCDPCKDKRRNRRVQA